MAQREPGPRPYRERGDDEKGAPRRRPMFRRKVCRFCADKTLKIDYKDIRMLTQFVTELALIYGLFALMTVLLFGLLGRLRSIELLVSGIAGIVFTLTGGLLFYFYGSWPAVVQDVHRSLSQNLTAAMRIHDKMGFPQD